MDLLAQSTGKGKPGQKKLQGDPKAPAFKVKKSFSIQPEWATARQKKVHQQEQHQEPEWVAKARAMSNKKQ